MIMILYLFYLAGNCKLILVVKSFFKYKLEHKATWIHPRSLHIPIIDYVIIRGRRLGAVLIAQE